MNTEEKLEEWYERQIDKLDARFIKFNDLNQTEYDRECADLDREYSEMLAELRENQRRNAG